MMDRHTLMKKGSRVLAIMLAGAMVVSLGADLSPTTEAYAAESQVQYKDEEHHHTDECYEEQETKELICGETEHTHDDDCYKTTEELTCEQDTHSHSEECYDEDGNLICEQTEHEHTDECYTTVRGDLTCDKEEHEHDDDCYETVTKDVLICGKEEHTHTEDCVVPSNNNEDDTVTKNADYDKDYIDAAKSAIDNDNSDIDNLIAVAASQAGYTQQIADDTEKDAYTLYGNWYSNGNNSGMAWDAAYVAWCLDKVGIDTERDLDVTSLALPVRSDLSSWIKALQAKEDATLDASDNGDVYDTEDEDSATIEALSLYIDAEDGIALTAGDIAFLDLDQNGKVDHVGIVASTDETEDESAKEIAIYIPNVDAGTLADYVDDTDEDADPAVVAVTIPGDSFDWEQDDADTAAQDVLAETVMGYIPTTLYLEQMEAIESGDTDNADEGDDNGPDIQDPDAIYGTTYTDKTSGIKHLVSKAPSYYSNDGVMPTDAGETGLDMNGYITSASFQKKNGVIWEESTEFTTTDQVRGTINFENIYTSTIKNNGNTIYIDLPAYINCSAFTGTYDTYDGSTHSGKYTYQKNADGTYRIVLVLDDDYVNDAGDTIGGSLQFNFQWTKDAVDDSGTKKVEIGNWSSDLKIKEDSSGDDKPSSANYSIYKQAGSLQIDSNGYAYIDYTVTLTVKNGMTAPINMKDVLTGEGFTYDSTISVTGGDVHVNFGNTEGQGTSTQIQLWPNSGSTVEPGTYTIKYRVKSLSNVTDPSTAVPSQVSNSIAVPEKGDDSISSETHTSTTSGVINKQGQLVSGSDATYIDYTVYLNAGAIIKNLKEPAKFTDTLPNTLELQGDVTVTQYDVSGRKVSSTTATVDGQNISYNTPIGQYYYVITYRTKVKDSDIPLGSDITIKNDGKSTGGVDGSSSSEIKITNHKLTKILKNGETNKEEQIRTSNWSSNVAVKGDLEGYVYEDYSSLTEDTTATGGKVKAMTLVEDSVVVKDASGNTISSDLYTLEDSTHTNRQWYIDQNYDIPDGLFKITFKKGVTGPVTIEYQTTTDMSKLVYGYVTNFAELSKDGHTDKAQATDRFDLSTDYNGLIYKKQDESQYSGASGTTTLKPGENTIPWVILINRDHTMTGDFTVTDTIKDGLIFLPETLEIRTDQGTLIGKEGVTWSYDKETGKLTVNVKESAYRIQYQAFTHTSVTITFKTQIPDSVIKSNQTEITYKNTATLETNGNQYDSTYEQKVIREVVGKSGSYDKNTHILSYTVVINADASTLNGGNTLTVTDTLDAGKIADYVKLHSLEVFTALKTTDAKGNVSVEPGELVKALTQTTDPTAKTEFMYTWDEANKKFTTYLPDSYGYVIVAKYYIDTDVTEDVQMKNTAAIEGNDSWKKEDSSTRVEANTAGETHTDKVTVVKHDTAQYSTLLSGASFQLDKYENDAWVKVGEATTDQDGKASINPIEYNKLYRLGETQSPDGYIVDEGPVYFVVVPAGTDSTVTLPDSIEGETTYSKDAVKYYTVQDGKKANIEIDRYNSKGGSLEVTKTDENGTTTLAGAVFDIQQYDKSTKTWSTVTSITTGEGGKAAWGSINKNVLYRMVETNAPSGYKVDPKPSYFIAVKTGDTSYTEWLPATDTYTSNSIDRTINVADNLIVRTFDDKVKEAEFEITRKDEKDIEQGQIRVTKAWVDAWGQPVTDETKLSTMPEVTVTLTKHVAKTTPVVTIKAQDSLWSDQKTQEVNPGGYLVFNLANYQFNQLDWSCTDSNVGMTSSQNADGSYTVKLGPISSSCTVVGGNLYWANGGMTTEGGTPVSGTDDTVIETVNLKPGNDWTYLWTSDKLDLTEGVMYSITETTVDGYETTYQINGSELKAGDTFTLGEKGDLVTITNTADRQYELPSTGGMGTLPYTLGGSAALISSMFAGCSIRRRRRDERRCD